MRKLIMVKRGDEVIANRDVTMLETELEIQGVIDTLKAKYPDDDLQWIKHQCGEDECTEEAFNPNEIDPTLIPGSEPVFEQPVVVKKPVVTAPKKPSRKRR